MTMSESGFSLGRALLTAVARSLASGCLILSLVGSRGQAEEKLPQLLRRIAFGSCAEQFKSQPIWKAVVEKRPDLFLFLGDNIYADVTGVTSQRAVLVDAWFRV